MEQMLENNTSIDILAEHSVHKNAIDHLLLEFINTSVPVDLHAFMKDALFPGRRLRPALLKMLAPIHKDSSINNTINNLCISVELCHRSSIIIDDLIDGDLIRRNTPTFFTSKGVENTMLIAHYIVSEAYKIIDALPNTYKLKIFSSFTNAYNKISYGELGDIGSLKSESFFELFRKKILFKTSALYELLFIWTAYLHNFSENQVIIFGNIGLKIGELYQIYNDIYDDLESRIDERGEKEFYKINLSLMSCIVLDYGENYDREKVLSSISKSCSKEEYLNIKCIQKRDQYTSIAKQYADKAYKELLSLISAIEKESLKNSILAFSLWLKQEKCWDQKEFKNAGY